VLGFFWSFVNPLLLLLTYGVVFTYMLPVPRGRDLEPYFLFLFCGILPWTWFNSSVLEASGGLIAGGSLIKKVMFPAEVLPVVTVLTNLVQFLLGLPILLLFLIPTGRLTASALLLPLLVLVQLVLTVGLSRTSCPTCCTSGSSPPPCSTRMRRPRRGCARCCVSTP
jgi:lipopolysaccharide transport system permease protein